MNLLLAASRGAMVTDATAIFFIVLVVILFAPLLLRRLRIPHVVGLILAGILIGPFGFNVVERDRSFEIFGQVGIYYIMFLAALELDMGSMQRYARRGLAFGLLTFAVPFVVGFGVMYWAMGFGVPTSLLLSCIFASHTLVTYPIVGRYGMTRHPSVVVSVVATAIATFGALLVLAVTVGSMNPDAGWAYWLWFAVRCVLYGLFVLLVYPRVGRWFLRKYDDNVMQFIFILSLLFLSATLAQLAGLEGLLGAFLAGLVVSRLVPRTSPLMNRIEFVGNALFIPYFLIGVGMIINPRVMLSDWSVMRLALVIVAVATATKAMAAWLMNWLLREEGKHAALLMFGLTNAHAAGALAIVMIGTAPEVNLMDVTVLNGTVMLILFSCIISSFATNFGARQLALRDTSLEDNRGSYHGKCLVTYSQQANVDNMTQLAMLIRNPYIPDSLMGLAVAYDSNAATEQHLRGRRLLELAQKQAAAADIHMATMSRVATNIASGILHTMREYDCGEVVMCLADRVTGMPKSSLGTIIDNVIAGTHREVMVIRYIVPPGTVRRVVIAVPQNAQYEVGFYKWIEHVCRIGEQLDCHLEYHAHPDTLPYIQGYMQKKHGSVRTEYRPLPHWGQMLKLARSVGDGELLVVVTARPGFISYRNSFDALPIHIHRFFSHTSVMLLYPDQWGEPNESVSIFQPNGQAVTRQRSWLKRLFRK
ncbi:MAG: cation:proton antiporter [Bacteroidaceae bacterium]|nr:cation:proton antiporter [Bacteroidaceae bacterium]